MSDTFSLDDFQGSAGLFPLPNLVVFPHVVQPLHIFESRYIEMLEDSVARDNLLAMGLLLPGWEKQYEGRPPVDPFVCLARVLSHTPTKDDRYNILLGGITRAKVIQELPPKKSYREVELKLLQDIEPDGNDPEVHALHEDLVSAVKNCLPDKISAQNQLGEILNMKPPLGTLTDLISCYVPLDLAFRQTLLSELDVVQRTRLLLERLKQEPRPFPPEFSEN